MRALFSHQFRTLVCLYQSVVCMMYVLCSVQTHRQTCISTACQEKYEVLDVSNCPTYSNSYNVKFGHWFNVNYSKAGLQTSSHPQALISRLFGLQVTQQTPALSLPFHYISNALRYLQLALCIYRVSFRCNVIASCIPGICRAQRANTFFSLFSQLEGKLKQLCEKA